MKKMIVYLVTLGMGLILCGFMPINASAHGTGHRHHMKKEERREERRMRKAHAHAQPYNYNSASMSNSNWYPKPALPVLEAYVPPNVVSTFEHKYGAALYDITPLIPMNGVDRYVVRIMNNGVTEAITVDGTGAPAM